MTKHTDKQFDAMVRQWESAQVELIEENRRLALRIKELEMENAHLRARITELPDVEELELLKSRIKELEAKRPMDHCPVCGASVFMKEDKHE
jgi:predicted nuclease with TOPRIM domain